MTVTVTVIVTVTVTKYVTVAKYLMRAAQEYEAQASHSAAQGTQSQILIEDGHVNDKASDRGKKAAKDEGVKRPKKDHNSTPRSGELDDKSTAASLKAVKAASDDVILLSTNSASASASARPHAAGVSSASAAKHDSESHTVAVKAKKAVTLKDDVLAVTRAVAKPSDNDTSDDGGVMTKKKSAPRGGTKRKRAMEDEMESLRTELAEVKNNYAVLEARVRELECVLE